MEWVIWIMVLLAQNASFTLVSRARNSDNLKYHAAGSVLSNGIWFVSQFFVVNILVHAKAKPSTAILAGLLYTAVTTISAVATHALLMHKVEKKINVKVS